MNRVTIKIFMALVFCTLFPCFAFPEGDKPSYTMAEYNAYLKTHETSSLDQKEAAIIEFLNWRGESSLLPNVLYELQLYFEARIQNRELERAEIFAKRLLASYPTAKDVAERVMATICLDRKDYSHYLVYAEPVFERNPSSRMAVELAAVAMKAKDEGRCDKYADFVERTGSLQERADLFFTLSRDFATEGQEEKSLAYAKKVIAALDLPQKPSDFTGDWEMYQMQILNPSLGFVGVSHFKAKEYSAAIDAFDKILSRNPRDGATYYYRGASWSNQGELEKALQDFARAAILDNGTVSETALEMMRKILEVRGQSPIETNKYISDAKAELGLS